jgi:hypothetical protein
METGKADMLRRQFNETIGQWIAWLDDYTLHRLHQRPHEKCWSLGQVYMHIIDETAYFVEQATACLNKNANNKKGMHEDAADMFAKNGFPDALLDSPTNDLNMDQPESKEQILNNLLSIREAVNKLYASFDLSKATGKIKHPGLLYFNAREWLQFAEMHMRHHFRQKKRIDEKLKQLPY